MNDIGRRRRWRRIGLWLGIAVVAGAMAVALLERRRLHRGWLAYRARAGDHGAWFELDAIDPAAAAAALELSIEVRAGRESEASAGHDTLTVTIRNDRAEPVALEPKDVMLWIRVEQEHRFGPDGLPLHEDGCGRGALQVVPAALDLPRTTSASFPLSVGVFCGLLEHSKCGPLTIEGALSGIGSISAGDYHARLQISFPARDLFDTDADAPRVTVLSDPFILELRDAR